MSVESPETISKNKLEKVSMFEDQSVRSDTGAKELVHISMGTGVILLGKVLGRGIQYLYIITIAHMLGWELFGVFMLGLTILSFARALSGFGLDTGALRFVALYKGVGDKARVKGVIVQSLKYTLMLSIIVGACLFLAAKPLLGKLFNKPELEIVIKLLCFSMPFFMLMTMALAFTRGAQIMKYTVYSENIFWPICNLVLSTIFFVIGFGLRGILVAHVISLLLASILSLYFLSRTFPAIRQTEAIPETRKLLRFSAPLLLATFLSFLVMWTDTLMLGYFRSSEEVGVYNAAIRTAMLTSMFLASYNTIFAPIISDLYNREEIHKLTQIFKITTSWVYTASLPVFLLIVLLSKEIMTIFGREFLVGWSCLTILAFTQFVNASVGSVGTLLVMSGKQDLMMYNTLGICVLNILLNYLLIPSWGMLGASITSGISLIVFNVLMLLQVRILLRIHPFNRKFLNPTLFAMTAFVIVLLLKSMLTNWTGMQKLFISVPLFLLVFITLMYKWGLDSEDMFIFNTVKGKLQKKMIGYKNQVEQKG